MWNNNTTGVVLLIRWYHISGGILYPLTIVPSNKQAHNVWDSLFITFIKSRVHERKQQCTIQKSYQTFFSASTIAWKLLAARCNALSAWFLFQNDANLYLTLPEHGKCCQYTNTPSMLEFQQLYLLVTEQHHIALSISFN